MAAIASTGLFPKELVTEIFSKVQGHSSIAKLAGSMPVKFSGNEIMTFAMDGDVSIVGEGAAKPSGDATITPVTVTPVKVVYQSRINQEFMYCAEEKRVEYLTAFAEGFAKKLAAGLDIMAFHGLNPATTSASTLIGYNSIDTATGVDKVVSSAAEADLTLAIAGIDVPTTGIAMSPAFATDLAATTRAGGQTPYEDFMWGGNPGAIRGIPCDVNKTVAVSASTTAYDLAIVGDFQNYFKWGYAANLPLEIIEYGNPDGGSYDLKQANQILLRSEAYIGWAILDPSAFARIAST